MNTIKLILFDRFRVLFTLTIFMGVCIILLMMRLKLSQSFFFLFLVWNLFLATIPHILSITASVVVKKGKAMFLLLFITWLLFLPNAPYLVTDLIHLRLSEFNMLPLDIVLISVFSITGLLLYFLSFKDMMEQLKLVASKKVSLWVYRCVPFLTAFGIYLGRFLRWNSWDIIHNPLLLFRDIMQMIIFPNQYLREWIFIICFGLLLSFGFKLFQQYVRLYLEEDQLRK